MAHAEVRWVAVAALVGALVSSLGFAQTAPFENSLYPDSGKLPVAAAWCRGL
jgi:hypothetical protein